MKFKEADTEHGRYFLPCSIDAPCKKERSGRGNAIRCWYMERGIREIYGSVAQCMNVKFSQQ
jgi:hypothetical protein